MSGTARRRVRRSLSLSQEQSLQVLTCGDIELEGRLRDASNTTLRAYVTYESTTVRCVYKPIQGERPLWDFPDGTLAAREVSAYLVSEAAGWNVVPLTVMRDGPLGPGACQLWIDEPDTTPRVGFVAANELPEGWLTIAAAEDEDGDAYLLAHADDPDLARMAIFDVVINNADRKGGHVLYPGDGSLRGVDHGVCFHIDDKLRTVLWGWVGRPLPEAEVSALTGLRTQLTGALGQRLVDLLQPDEVEATINRVERLLAAGVFPTPRPGRPAVPWPPI